ncbi:hypothetical protein N657DRAFT_682237 [Parathielavia appendiculata]|uniref:Uncharacterized protein n=1 Tax=Parathielavia appendiculata TaxID=2587402 RepID=A0AAN6TXB1_9PEZI|nr:hypothetical protein N657DRAFT_682237 [Parathielavia appendiculata]
MGNEQAGAQSERRSAQLPPMHAVFLESKPQPRFSTRLLSKIGLLYIGAGIDETRTKALSLHLVWFSKHVQRFATRFGRVTVEEGGIAQVSVPRLRKQI